MHSGSAAQEAPVVTGNGESIKAIPTPLEWVHNQYGAAAESLPRPTNWTAVMEAPLYTPRKMRVVTIGAGFSGLMVAHKVKARIGGRF